MICSRNKQTKSSTLEREPLSGQEEFKAGQRAAHGYRARGASPLSEGSLQRLSTMLRSKGTFGDEGLTGFGGQGKSDLNPGRPHPMPTCQGPTKPTLPSFTPPSRGLSFFIAPVRDGPLGHQAPWMDGYSRTLKMTSHIPTVVAPQRKTRATTRGHNVSTEAPRACEWFEEQF